MLTDYCKLPSTSRLDLFTVGLDYCVGMDNSLKHAPQGKLANLIVTQTSTFFRLNKARKAVHFWRSLTTKLSHVAGGWLPPRSGHPHRGHFGGVGRGGSLGGRVGQLFTEADRWALCGKPMPRLVPCGACGGRSTANGMQRVQARRRAGAPFGCAAHAAATAACSPPRVATRALLLYHPPTRPCTHLGLELRRCRRRCACFARGR